MNKQTLSSALEESFLRFKDQTAIRFDGNTFTYSDLDKITGKLAGELVSEGLKPGDRVAVRLPKGMAVVIVHLACLRSGIVTLPLNPLYSEEELKYFLSDSRARGIVVEVGEKSFIELLRHDLQELEFIHYVDHSGREWIEQDFKNDRSISRHAVRPDDGAIMFYTSGTTGPPKGCIMAQKSCIVNLTAISQAWGITDKDRLMHVLPLNHAHGLYVALFGSLLNGCFVFMKKSFDAEEVLRDIDDHKLSLFMGVPTHYNRFLKIKEANRFSIDSMRLFISGSAPLSQETFTDFKETFGYEVLERYGMTEIGIHVSNPLKGERLPGKVGFPLPGAEARVVDIGTGDILGPGKTGELQVRGPNVFSGYWRKPEETEKCFSRDGWFKTGDLAEVNEDGYFSIVGRLKDLIISGGLNISPLEVESVINSHPAVSESAVIGVPDRDFGEKVVAYIVLNENCKAPSLEEIQAVCKQHLSSFKKPKEIYPVEKLPRNAMGKILKQQLRMGYSG
ncbi:MAG: AMP-binding protein [Deltaproteobacteria bacterium]|nr:AMP-binding protein [Deltaproteobacteria bacterium]